jgi:DNA-binding PadR family transcriptional regulator
MPTARPNSTRLFILGTLLGSGPMHGHQIRREAQLNRTELWTEVQVGALYGALHRLEAEGLIAAVRSEQQGRYPERTVYAITDEGRREFSALRSIYLRDAALRSDPFDLALSLSSDLPTDELRNTIQDRIQTLAAAAQSLGHQYDEARHWLTPRESAIFRHLAVRLEAELAWHRELLLTVPSPPAGEEGGASQGGQRYGGSSDQ